MIFDSEIITYIIDENFLEDVFDFELNTVRDIIDENADCTDDEKATAYAMGLIIFGDCLKRYGQRIIDKDKIS